MDTLLENVIKKKMNDNDVEMFLSYIEKKKIDIVQLLLENGASANSEGEKQSTALFYAILTESLEMVELLIKFNANVNHNIKGEFTALIMASFCDCVEIAELLLKNDANIDAADRKKMTALMHAAEKGYTNMIQLLIDHNSSLEAISLDGKTALIFAVSKGRVDAVKMLIRSGANVQAVSKVQKKSVTMYAARAGETATVDILIQSGAKIGEKDSNGMTALDHAVKEQKISTVYRLLSAYSLEEQDKFATNSPKNLNIVNNFDKNLYKYQEKIYLILKTPYKLKIDSAKECHFSMFPEELINLIKQIEVKLCDFPDWYQHRIERDTGLAFNLKARVLLTSAYDSKKSKSDDNLKQDNQFDAENEAYLKHSFSNLKFN